MCLIACRVREAVSSAEFRQRKFGEVSQRLQLWIAGVFQLWTTVAEQERVTFWVFEAESSHLRTSAQVQIKLCLKHGGCTPQEESRCDQYSHEGADTGLV